MKKLLIIGLLALSFTSLICYESNAKSEDDVGIFVQSMSDKAIDIASDESISIEERREGLIDLFNQTVDLNWVTRFIMGKHYRTANKEQREKFLTLYQDYLIKVYAPRFNGYDGKEFNILEINSEYEDEYLAKTKYISNDDKEVFIDFLVVYDRKNEKFYVNDFVAEGISFIVSQRSEINSAISKNGLDSFLDELETRIENLEKKDDEATKSVKSK